MTEHQIQAAIVDWWDAVGSRRWPGPVLMAIPNGGARDRITGALLKAEGVRPGVPDLFLACTLPPPALRGGLWIEVKTKAGRVSAHQHAMLHRLYALGYDVAIVRSAAEAIEAITKYMDIRAIQGALRREG